MGRVAPGQQQNFGNDFMRMAVMMQQANYDKERAAYYGTAKESEIANRRAQMQDRENKQLDTETEREFSQETGLPFKKGVDEPMVAGLRAAKRSEIPPAQPMRREQGPWAKLFSPTPPPVLPTTPYEDPEITEGRKMGQKAAMVPNLYEQAQKQVQDMGYNDPKSPTYSPEAARMANTRTMRPEDVDTAAKKAGELKEQSGKARAQDIAARSGALKLSIEQENAKLTDYYSKLDPNKDKQQRDEILRRIALNHGGVGNVATMDENKRTGYLAATKQSSDAVQKLVEAQAKYPDKIDMHAGLAHEASVANLAAAELENSPMVDVITAMPYNSKNPFSGQYTKSNRVKVPTDFAKADRDGVLHAMIRAPINPKDAETDQSAQMDKQGSYLAWEIVKQNPEFLGNPQAFNAAVDKVAGVNDYVKLVAKHHMGTYLQVNNGDPRSEVEKRKDEKPTPLGPPTPDPYAFRLPGGKDPQTGEPLEGPEVSPQAIGRGIKGLLPQAPEGGMFGTDKTVEDYKREDRPREPYNFPGIEDVPSEVPLNVGPATSRAPVTPQRGSNLPTIKGVPRVGANIPPNKSLIDSVIRAESSGNPGAIGKKGEVGLMQLREEAAKEMGLSPEERKDPVKNREAGTKYLEKQVRRFGSVEKGLAAFNWGPDNVAKAIAQHGENWMAAVPESTKRYIKKIMAGS